MEFTVLKTKVSVSPLFFAVLTMFLLLDKTGISGFVVLFSVLHETGHILALICEKIHPKSFKISFFGIHISLPESLSTAEKLPVLMAGFSVNFLLAALFFVLKNHLLGYMNIIIGIFTSVPISSTDGGMILKIILEDCIQQKAEKIFKSVSEIFVFVLSIFLFSVSVAAKNYFILIAVVYMIYCNKKAAA